MIHDNASFIAEYQFVNKPMIFLTREGESFNKMGSDILNVSYLIDGKKLYVISEAIRKIFIKGKDKVASQRKKVFNKYLNSPKVNGMSASEFIYKNIADELKPEIL